jgi:hypothetical protein
MDCESRHLPGRLKVSLVQIRFLKEAESLLG